MSSSLVVLFDHVTQFFVLQCPVTTRVKDRIDQIHLLVAHHAPAPRPRQQLPKLFFIHLYLCWSTPVRLRHQMLHCIVKRPIVHVLECTCYRIHFRRALVFSLARFRAAEQYRNATIKIHVTGRVEHDSDSRTPGAHQCEQVAFYVEESLLKARCDVHTEETANHRLECERHTSNCQLRVQPQHARARGIQCYSSEFLLVLDLLL